jgi:UMF1 family MFS transporter
MTVDAMDRRRMLAWTLYDWGNSAFATVVMAGFFPLFFRSYWSAGQDSAQITLHLGMANSIGSLVIVLSAPLLGALADQGSFKKRFLSLFALLGIAMTLGLYWVAQGEWLLAAMLYAAASIGFMGANIFYDALLVDVAPPHRYDFVSGLGYAMGYLGGGLLFAFCVYMVLNPAVFGFADDAAVRLSFLLVGIWWLLFTLPLLFLVKETPHATPRAGVVTGGFRQLINTFREVRRYREVWWFLLAYWLYIDGVDTIVRMAADYGAALGFSAGNLILALLMIQFIGFPAAIAFGKFGERIGPKTGIYIGLAAYAAITVWGALMTELWEFFAIAVGVGLVQGGVQSLSRSLYARLIPQDKATEFFGFYNMLGKFAAVAGPFLMGIVGVLTGSPRIAIFSLLVFFVLGALLLLKVPERKEQKA